jgi:hypothetical protein
MHTLRAADGPQRRRLRRRQGPSGAGARSSRKAATLAATEVPCRPHRRLSGHACAQLPRPRWALALPAPASDSQAHVSDRHTQPEARARVRTVTRARRLPAEKKLRPHHHLVPPTVNTASQGQVRGGRVEALHQAAAGCHTRTRTTNTRTHARTTKEQVPAASSVCAEGGSAPRSTSTYTSWSPSCSFGALPPTAGAIGPVSAPAAAAAAAAGETSSASGAAAAAAAARVAAAGAAGPEAAVWPAPPTTAALVDDGPRRGPIRCPLTESGRDPCGLARDLRIIMAATTTTSRPTFELVLGSSSRWRRQVLDGVGLPYTVATADIDEDAVTVGGGALADRPRSDPALLSQTIARGKAAALLPRFRDVRWPVPSAPPGPGRPRRLTLGGRRA